MRLSSKVRDVIREAVREVYGPEAVVRLFGSRVHDHLRGGDIDLHVEADSIGPERFPSRRTKLWAMLQQRLGEQRIDIVVADPRRHDRAIDRLARRDGVAL